MRILVVEDDEQTAAYMVKGLTESGFTVDVAEDGEDGLGLARSGDHDLIVLDGFVTPSLPAGASVLLLHPPPNNGWLTVGNDVSISSITASRPDDPIVQDVPLDGTHVSRSRYLTPPAWADTVLSAVSRFGP